jgi:hypothetical protein
MGKCSAAREQRGLVQYCADLRDRCLALQVYNGYDRAVLWVNNVERTTCPLAGTTIRFQVLLTYHSPGDSAWTSLPMTSAVCGQSVERCLNRPDSLPACSHISPQVVDRYLQAPRDGNPDSGCPRIEHPTSRTLGCPSLFTIVFDDSFFLFAKCAQVHSPWETSVVCVVFSAKRGWVHIIYYEQV